MADGIVGFRFRLITVIHSSPLASCTVLGFLGAGVGAPVAGVVTACLDTGAVSEVGTAFSVT